jgi:type IV pilus assembly protein PilY1
MYVSTGSGDRERPLVSNYPYTTPVTNRFYTYLDDLSIEASSAATATNMDDVASYMADFSSAASSTCSLAGVSPGSNLKGWFMNLDGRGEQTITSPLIAGGMVTFNTNRPTPASATSCRNPMLGESRGYWLNLLNASGGIGVSNAACGGARSSVFAGGGLTPSPTMASVSIGGKVTTVVIGAVQLSGGASSGIAPQAITPAIKSTRRIIYWKSDAASQ